MLLLRSHRFVVLWDFNIYTEPPYQLWLRSLCPPWHHCPNWYLLILMLQGKPWAWFSVVGRMMMIWLWRNSHVRSRSLPGRFWPNRIHILCSGRDQLTVRRLMNPSDFLVALTILGANLMRDGLSSLLQWFCTILYRKNHLNPLGCCSWARSC